MVMASDGDAYVLTYVRMLMVILVLMVLMNFILMYLDVGPGFYICTYVLVATTRLCPMTIRTDDHGQLTTMSIRTYVSMMPNDDTNDYDQ